MQAQHETMSKNVTAGMQEAHSWNRERESGQGTEPCKLSVLEGLLVSTVSTVQHDWQLLCMDAEEGGIEMQEM